MDSLVIWYLLFGTNAHLSGSYKPLSLIWIKQEDIQMNEIPGGLWPVMLTPFNAKGDIDLDGLEALTEFYIASGASGLFVNCLSSEMFQISPKERLALTKAVVRFVAGRLPVISTGTFSQDAKENVNFIHSIYKQGVAAVVINSNQICTQSEGEGLFHSRLESLVKATKDIPLGMYECPVPYKRLLSLDLVEWMASTGRFLYFKDTCCDKAQIKARLSVTKDSVLSLYNANTPTALQSLRDGAAGLSPIGANFYPELYSYLYRNVQKEETLEFTKVRLFLSINDPVVHTLYPYSAKWFLQQRGLPITLHTRTPVPKARKEEMMQLQELLAGMEALLKILKP